MSEVNIVNTHLYWHWDRNAQNICCTSVPARLISVWFVELHVDFEVGTLNDDPDRKVKGTHIYVTENARHRR